MISVLSVLLPALLFAHALWRIFRGGRLRRVILTVTPSISLAMTTVWLATSLMAVINGALSAAAQHANATTGPVLAFFLLAMVELPFGVHRVHVWLKKDAGTKTAPSNVMSVPKSSGLMVPSKSSKPARQKK